MPKFMLALWAWKWQRSLLLFESSLTMVKWFILILTFDLVIEQIIGENTTKEGVLQLH